VGGENPPQLLDIAQLVARGLAPRALSSDAEEKSG
jgi:hypothetical protein